VVWREPHGLDGEHAFLSGNACRWLCLCARSAEGPAYQARIVHPCCTDLCCTSYAPHSSSRELEAIRNAAPDDVDSLSAHSKHRCLIFSPRLHKSARASLVGSHYCDISILAVRTLKHWSTLGTPELPIRDPRPSRTHRFFWLAFTACGSVLLLAITNELTQDVATVPLLWIAPLSIYLFTFILCFSRFPLYWRPLYETAFIFLSLVVAIGWTQGFDAAFLLSFIFHLVLLFVACMICHGELVRLKPTPSHLTSFYVYIAVGGALGGLFVSIVSPLIFPGLYELPLGISACWLLMFAINFRNKQSSLYRGRHPFVWMYLFSLLGVFLAFSWHAVKPLNGTLDLSRSFYGILSVQEVDRDNPSKHRIKLQHGSTIHGEQYIEEDLRSKPLSYYGEGSGIEIAMKHTAKRPGRNIGIAGLGAGTLAAYGKKGDTIRFYEIDPNIIDHAEKYFTYLEDTNADVEVVLGDARLSMEAEPSQEFDILALDAFTSDAIPVHLLTKEAFEVYLLHMKSDGIIVVHISNRHLDIFPILQAVASHFGLDLLHIDRERDKTEEGYLYASDWVLLSQESLDVLHSYEEEPLEEGRKNVKMWTDDYSNIFDVLKIRITEDEEVD